MIVPRLVPRGDFHCLDSRPHRSAPTPIQRKARVGSTVRVRVVVLLGGLLQGFGLVMASQVQSLPVFLATYGIAVGLAARAIYVPLTAATSRPDWRSARRWAAGCSTGSAGIDDFMSHRPGLAPLEC